MVRKHALVTCDCHDFRSRAIFRVLQWVLPAGGAGEFCREFAPPVGVAVHSQHRGRLFLPFADDDPRTAEVVSKVLLLARDREIRDPNILEWIRAAQGA
jgi:hypothetical protein